MKIRTEKLEHPFSKTEARWRDHQTSQEFNIKRVLLAKDNFDS